MKYLKTYFFIDLVTSVPFTWIPVAFSSFNKIVRVVKIPKIVTGLKMNKSLRIAEALKTLGLGELVRYKIKIREGLLNTITILLFTYLVLHISAMIFILVGQIDTVNSWIIHNNLEDASNFEIYLNSIYYCFVVLTTVGYGDITSINSWERLFTIIYMYVGIAFYSYTISFITRFFTTIDNSKALLTKKLRNFERFHQTNNIDPELSEKVKESLEYASTKISYRWTEGSFNLLKDAPLELKYDFYYEIHQEILKSPFFHSRDSSFAVRVIELLRPVKLKANQHFWKKESDSNCIIFIVQGEMMLLMENPFFNKNDMKKAKPVDLKKFTTSIQSGQKPKKGKRSSTFHKVDVKQKEDILRH